MVHYDVLIRTPIIISRPRRGSTTFGLLLNEGQLISLEIRMKRSRETHQIPDNDIVARMSDVQINLTQPQYFSLLALATAIPKILDFSELDEKPMRPKPASTPESHFSGPTSGPQLSQSRLTHRSTGNRSTAYL